MEKHERFFKKDIVDEDIGFLLWHIQEIENFYPCYRTLIRKDEE